MIKSFLSFVSNRFYDYGSRKRSAGSDADNEPCAKMSRMDGQPSSNVGDEWCGDKENMDGAPVNDHQQILSDEHQSAWVSPRKTIHPLDAACTSTPIPASENSSMKWRQPNSRDQTTHTMLRPGFRTGAKNVKANDSDTNISILKNRRFFNTQRGGVSSRNKSIADKVFRSFGPSCSISSKNLKSVSYSSRQLKEKMQYQNLLAKYQQGNGLLSSALVGIQLKKRSEQIPVVDLTQDITVLRVKEKRPSTSATRAAISDEIQILKIKENTRTPILRVNSLQDLIDRNPSFADITDVCRIKENHAAATSEKQRLASIEETKIAILSPHNQTAIHIALEERIRNYIKITEPPTIIEEDEVPPYVLPDLTPEQESMVDHALKPNPPGEVLSQKFGLSITRRDMATLKGLNWLNDEVINFYMNLVMERSKENVDLPQVYAFNTFFYPKLVSGGHSGLKRWTRRVDIFKHDFIFVPVHLGMHWCMSVIDVNEKEIRYHDSLGGDNETCVLNILSYLEAESLDKKKVDLNACDWKTFSVEDTPQQLNGSDCGMFSCTVAEHVARNEPLLFSQEHMPYLRRKMIFEILNGALIT